MNIEEARLNMLNQQLRPWGVTDQSVLDLIAHTPREHFVPQIYHNLAFADMNIPLPQQQVMLTPKEEGLIMQVLAIQSTERILEIGTGSGYMTALLAKQGKHVDSLEIFPDLTQTAQLKLAALGLTNIHCVVADATQTTPTWQGNYDVIVITGSLPHLPAIYRQCLNPAGRLFVILGAAPAMEATLITHHPQQGWLEKKLFETVIPPLLSTTRTTEFVF